MLMSPPTPHKPVTRWVPRSGTGRGNERRAISGVGGDVAEQLATLHVQATKATGGNPGLAVRYANAPWTCSGQAGLSDTAAYATALRESRALHGMQGQIRPGLAAIDEAAAVFTQLLEVDSSHRVELASALATRAQLLLEDRRNLAGRDTAIAAVEHYQRIPQLGLRQY